VKRVLASIILVVLVACGPPPPRAPIAQHVAPAPAGPQIYRTLSAGLVRKAARRTTFALASDGERASIVETEEIAIDARTIDEVDRGAKWTVTSTRTYRGTRRGPDLDLTTDDMQPLHLHCMAQTVEVAAPRARRVPSPNRPADYECGDRGVWDPAATRRLDALVCGAPGQPADDADDDDRFVFAPAPGIELASENDDCAIHGGGLRQVP
jgi:hypothetical protein